MVRAGWGRTPRSVFASASAVVCAAMLVSIASAGPVAARTWTGGASNNNWMEPNNWSPVGLPTGNAAIDSSPVAIIGVNPGAPDNPSLSGGQVSVGSNGTGDLIMQNGSSLTTTGLFRLGVSASGVGTVTVTGPGSKLTLNNTISLIVGHQGTGTLHISDGGAVTTTGYAILSSGTVASDTLKITSGGAH